MQWYYVLFRGRLRRPRLGRPTDLSTCWSMPPAYSQSQMSYNQVCSPHIHRETVWFILDHCLLVCIRLVTGLTEIRLLWSDAAETSLSKVQKSSLLLAYEVNAVGPILVIKVEITVFISAPSCVGTLLVFYLFLVHCLNWSLSCQHMRPFLKIGASLETGKGFSLVANMSTRVGSIGDNGLGGWHSHRASKTALNQCMWTVRGMFVQISLSGYSY
jgi:hypothetical protein